MLPLACTLNDILAAESGARRAAVMTGLPISATVRVASPLVSVASGVLDHDVVRPGAGRAAGSSAPKWSSSPRPGRPPFHSTDR